MQAETLMMQFSNVTLCFACFVFLVYFVVCNLAKMYIVGFFFSRGQRFRQDRILHSYQGKSTQ